MLLCPGGNVMERAAKSAGIYIVSEFLQTAIIAMMVLWSLAATQKQ